MCRKLSYFICFALFLTWGGANVVVGDVWEGKITNSQDCVEQSSPGPTGAMDFGSSDLEFLDDGGIQTIGLRFTNVQVPAGAVITKAYVGLTQEENEADAPINIIIQAHLTPNAPAFTSTAGDIGSRPLTTAVAKWSPTGWTVDEQPRETSDISPVISEIVNQPGWVAGNALVLVFNQDPALASQSHVTTHKAEAAGMEPRLYVEYTLGSATQPKPADEETEVSRDAELSWKPGVFVSPTNGHKIYFSKNRNDVVAGTGGITQSAATYKPGRLEFGTTYYWRVDENNAPPKGGVNVGNVWSFTTELYSYPILGANIIATASSVGDAAFGPENTIDGSGLDENDLHSTLPDDMWLSGSEPAGAWIQYEFDKAYKLHEMWVWNSNQAFEGLFGFGFKDVTVQYSNDGTNWTTLTGVSQFTRAPGKADYAHNTTVNFGGIAAKFVKLAATSNWGGVLPQYSLSEVRFLYVPVSASKPSPESGATGVEVVGATLSWRAGREAATHKVYLSADQQAVTGGTATPASAATASYSATALDLSTSYYWKVAEVNEAETPTTWEGSVWSFTTSDLIVVDDFESYNDLNPDQPGSKRIFETWIDGYGTTTNGAVAANELPPYAEPKVVHGGKQSMPLAYGNLAGKTFSEATRTLTPAQDWSKHGIKTLVLWFQGTVGNTGQIYVKINNTKITYNGAAGNIALPGWQQWNIDLAASGASLQSVSSLTVGIDGNAAAGKLYIDDIRLYAVAPAPFFEAAITDENDDAEERIGPNNGAMDLGSSDLEMPYEDAGKVDPQIVGLRFPGVAIPKGATITNAWVQFIVDETRDGTQAANLIIDGELSPSPAAFGSTAGNITSRPRTAAKVQWSVPNWTKVGDKGPDQRTPNLAPVIQEIVNQNNWAGGAVVLMLRDDPAKPSAGSRAAGRGSNVVLHIEYK